MKRKLKLTDKIFKFFGQAGQSSPGREGGRDGGGGGGSGGSTARSGAGGVAGTIPAGCYPAPADWPAASGGAGGAGCGPGDARHGGLSGPATTLVSAKADLASNPRTTGNGDAALALQHEVCFPQLLDTLAHGSPEQRAVAAEALFNFTAESDAARQRAAAAGVVAHLTELLGSGTDHARMYAAYTLSSLTAIDDAIAQMRQQRAPAALVSLLATCPLLVCKKGAMRALGRLARNDDTAAEIVAAGGLRPIVSLLGHPDASLVRRCLVALYFIGADKPELQAQLGAVPGAVRQLIGLLRSDNADVRAEAADVVKVVSRSPTCGLQIAEAGGLDLLAAIAAGAPAVGSPISGGGGANARARASAARALQRLGELPELRHVLPPALHSGGATGAAGAAGTAAAGAQPVGAAAAPAAAAPTAATAGAGAVNRALLEEVASAAEGEDVRQLVEAVSRGSSWIRAKAAAAIEQAAAEDPAASKCVAIGSGGAAQTGAMRGHAAPVCLTRTAVLYLARAGSLAHSLARLPPPRPPPQGPRRHRRRRPAA
jgi:hypothetical protein